MIEGEKRGRGGAEILLLGVIQGLPLFRNNLRDGSQRVKSGLEGKKAFTTGSRGG